MSIIIDCFNLLGDSLVQIEAIKRRIAIDKDIVAVYVHPGLVYEMFIGSIKNTDIFVDLDIARAVYPEASVLRIGAQEMANYSFDHRNNIDNFQLHASEACAAILGVKLDSLMPNIDWQKFATLPKNIITVSPFSRSCTRHSKEGIPNKTLDDWKWEYIIRYLRRQGLPVKVIAGPEDRLSVNSVPLNDYVTAKNLADLEFVLKSSALLVSVDNGIGHVASALDVPMISLWPQASSIHFIGPRYGKQTMFIDMGNPNVVSPAQLLNGIRHFSRLLLGGSSNEILDIQEQGVGA